MSKDKEKAKKEVADNQENIILKKIRYYQGSIKDYETFWNDKISEGEKELSPETKAFAKTNAELNKAYEIIPVDKDDTVMCTDVPGGEVKSESEPEEKKEKKEEKHEEEEESKVKDEKKEEKDEEKEDDDDKKKKHPKKD